jgi:hypothetical protein
MNMNQKAGLTRRQFLSGCAAATAGLCLAACGLPIGPAASAQTGNFYLDHQDSIRKDVGKTMGFVRKVIAQESGETQAGQIVTATMSRFAELLPDLPDIGGSDNGLTQNLYQSAGALALYQVLKGYGKTAGQTGEILFRAVEDQFSSDPMAGMDGRMTLSESTQNRLRQAAEQSQQRRYPQDWVFQFIPGDESSFTYGVDYEECGIVKYYRSQKAEELTVYLCLLDFPLSNAMNTGLVRTETLAQGGRRCDFRYQMGRPCRMEWTPDFLKTGG